MNLPALTPRETALVDGVRRGLSNRDIGRELGITEGTVKVYMVRIFQKFGVTSRHELALKTWRCPACGLAGMAS